MNKLAIVGFCISQILSVSLFSQGDRGLQQGVQNGYFDKKCDACMTVLNTKPAEVLFGLEADEAGNIYFIMTDADWFRKMFAKSGDGVCVDVMLKSQYACDKENDIADSPVRQGHLLKPIYYRDFKDDILVQDGYAYVKIGEVPIEYRYEDYEMNLLLLRDEYVCYYQSFFNLATSRWQLLETGLFMDTIAGNSQKEVISNIPSEMKLSLSKTLKFTIPFEKGKSEYSQEDIQPLYDSLRLTDFTIISADIKAYSSVEGSTDKNIELQEKRAASILKALNGFQKKEIEANVQSSENWVEFITDMNARGDRSLVKLSKSEIKIRLSKDGLANDLEYILKDHRKAILVLQLQKKTQFYGLSNETVLTLYEESLLEKNIQQAIDIQQELFSRVSDYKLPMSVLEDVDVPEEIEYGPLLNNHAAYKYSLDQDDILRSLIAFRELEYILPEDVHIQYNLCVLELKAWLVGQSTIEPDQLMKDIDKLRRLGIDYRLINRLKINYYIIASEYHMFERDYAKKDEDLEYIFKKYRTLDLSSDDLLRLSKYFSSYARYDWAESVIKDEVQHIDADEDLLFYYLNLTIIDPESTQKSGYRTLMLNAVNSNKGRFCRIFDPTTSGGVNFQLLENSFLKSTYCENCN